MTLCETMHLQNMLTQSMFDCFQVVSFLLQIDTPYIAFLRIFNWIK